MVKKAAGREMIDLERAGTHGGSCFGCLVLGGDDTAYNLGHGNKCGRCGATVAAVGRCCSASWWSSTPPSWSAVTTSPGENSFRSSSLLAARILASRMVAKSTNARCDGVNYGPKMLATVE